MKIKVKSVEFLANAGAFLYNKRKDFPKHEMGNVLNINLYAKKR